MDQIIYEKSQIKTGKYLDNEKIKKKYLRYDIVLKTILRSMRKFYKDLFKNCTKYSYKKSRKGPFYYTDCVQKYSDFLSSEMFSAFLL